MARGTTKDAARGGASGRAPGGAGGAHRDTAHDALSAASRDTARPVSSGTARQLAFDLPAKPALGRDDFFVSAANALAVRAVDGWRDWPLGKLVLIGPPGAGKTHLAHVWAHATGARIVAASALDGADIAALAATGRIVVEDVPVIAGAEALETALFHLHNLLAEGQGRLLMTGAGNPARWALKLPDLASRVRATSLATLEAMDDALLTALLVKLFSDRQLNVTPNVITWLVRRMERSFAEASRIVDDLDRLALAQKRKVTRAMAAAVVDISPAQGQ